MTSSYFYIKQFTSSILLTTYYTNNLLKKIFSYHSGLVPVFISNCDKKDSEPSSE
jgi:hypothetical protein